MSLRHKMNNHISLRLFVESKLTDETRLGQLLWMEQCQLHPLCIRNPTSHWLLPSRQSVTDIRYYIVY